MYEELAKRLEANAAEYEVSLATVAEWEIEFATGRERTARSNVTRAATALAKKVRQRDRLLAGEPRRVGPYDEGRAIGAVESAEAKLDRRVKVLADQAHRLEDARGFLATLKVAA